MIINALLKLKNGINSQMITVFHGNIIMATSYLDIGSQHLKRLLRFIILNLVWMLLSMTNIFTFTKFKISKKMCGIFYCLRF